MSRRWSPEEIADLSSNLTAKELAKKWSRTEFAIHKKRDRMNISIIASRGTLLSLVSISKTVNGEIVLAVRRSVLPNLVIQYGDFEW